MGSWRWHLSDCFFWVDICIRGTVVDASLSLPVIAPSVQSGFNLLKTQHTSASAFHSFLISGLVFFHCSPMSLEMSGFVKPGCCARMFA